jgi:hypothetical protein
MAKTMTIAALALLAALGGTAYGETMVKTGKTSSGDTCKVSVERHADGSISAAGASSTTGSAGALSSSSSAGGSSVQIQAGGGHVSSSSSTSGGPGATSASTVTVNGCTISTSSP